MSVAPYVDWNLRRLGFKIFWVRRWPVHRGQAGDGLAGLPRFEDCQRQMCARHVWL